MNLLYQKETRRGRLAGRLKRNRANRMGTPQKERRMCSWAP